MTVRIDTFACNPVSFPFDGTPLFTMFEWFNCHVTVAMYTFHVLVSKSISRVNISTSASIGGGLSWLCLKTCSILCHL